VALLIVSRHSNASVKNLNESSRLGSRGSFNMLMIPMRRFSSECKIARIKKQLTSIWPRYLFLWVCIQVIQQFVIDCHWCVPWSRTHIDCESTYEHPISALTYRDNFNTNWLVAEGSVLGMKHDLLEFQSVGFVVVEADPVSKFVTQHLRSPRADIEHNWFHLKRNLRSGHIGSL